MAVIGLDRQLREFQEAFGHSASSGRTALYKPKIDALRAAL